MTKPVRIALASLMSGVLLISGAAPAFASPSITSFAASPLVFSPNGDGTRDATVISASINAQGTPTWTLTITNASGAIVRTFSQSGASVAQSWNGLDEENNALPDGDYSVQLSATDANGTALATVTTSIDLTPPRISMISPRKGGNVAYTSLPILLQIIDAPPPSAGVAPTTSGANTSTMTMKVVDLQNFAAFQTPGFVAESANTGDTTISIKSQPVTLIPGREYEVQATVSDNAGNPTTMKGRFLVMGTSAVSRPNVSIPQQPATTRISYNTSLDLYQWATPLVSAGSYTVQFASTKHDGIGATRITFNPQFAEVTYTTGGIVWSTNLRESSATFDTSFRINTSGVVTQTISNGSGRTQTLSALIPKNADAGSVRMRLNPTPATTAAFPTCSDPSANSYACTPDPITTLSLHETERLAWERLMDVDPYDVPAEVAVLMGLPLTSNRCEGTPPTLATALDHFGAAVGTDTSMRSGITLSSEVSAATARIVECFARYVPVIASVANASLAEQQTAWLEASRDISWAIKSIPAGATWPAEAVSLDILDKFVVGGTGNDTYTNHAILIIEPGGNDTYPNNAGGALGTNIMTALAAVVDLAGNDTYGRSTHSFRACDEQPGPSIGAGTWNAVGILIDADGADSRTGYSCSQGMGKRGLGLLLDLGNGSDTYSSYFSATNQNLQGPNGLMGVGTNGGIGILIDPAADQSPTTFDAKGMYNIGYGDGEGLGLVIGGAGNTTYRNVNTDTNIYGYGWSIGVATSGSKAVVLDPGGTDSYRCTGTNKKDFCVAVAWGPDDRDTAASAGTLGMVVDRGPGNDTYYGDGIGGMSHASGSGAAAILFDAGGVDSYNCASAWCFGASAYDGEGIFIDVGASDVDGYTCATSPAMKVPAQVLPTMPTSGACKGRGNARVWIGTRSVGNTADVFGFGLDQVHAP
ncbi:MAG TPA: FlgD immunoglobulin-like domain containing protein [Actinomycetota bacterium]|nr:FlgD immunoglobulin-like domain containing protein [Actinomycetota bacterium]